MTLCPRCGTGLLPSAAICTTCCHRLDGADIAPATVLIDVAVPSQPEPTYTSDADVEAHKVTQALTSWPFGGADAETVQAIAQVPAQAPPPPAEQLPAVPPPTPSGEPAGTIQATEEAERRAQIEAQYAALAAPDGLNIPNQRSAAFHPLQVGSTPPPNRYLEASRRQQANFATTRFEPGEVGGCRTTASGG